MAEAAVARASVALLSLAGPGAWRTLGLAWRPNAPRAGDFRALLPHVTEACREPEA